MMRKPAMPAKHKPAVRKQSVYTPATLGERRRHGERRVQNRTVLFERRRRSRRDTAGQALLWSLRAG